MMTAMNVTTMIATTQTAAVTPATKTTARRDGRILRRRTRIIGISMGGIKIEDQALEEGVILGRGGKKEKYRLMIFRLK
jgi:C-terminal processing protease CtpA/Prc